MEPTDANLRAWDEMHRRPAARIPQEVRDRLPPLEGLRVLLIEGTATTGAEIAAAGALVTMTSAGGTPSGDLPVVHAAPAQLPTELLRGRFDLVYLEQLPDTGLEPTFAGVQAALRPLGWVVVYSRHPSSGSRADYFDAWTLGDVVTAVSQAGLRVKRLEEYPSARDARLPGEFLLRAEKSQ